jgi:anthranilate phosphoribosyltransferase
MERGALGLMRVAVDDIECLRAGRDLSYDRIRQLLEMLDETGRVEESSYLAAVLDLMAKRLTVEELGGVVDDIAARSIDLSGSLDGFGALVDISGSGGDTIDTPNVGSLASFVAAAGGLPVAKQATRSFTGLTGSADVFALLGLDVMTASLEHTVSILRSARVTAIHTPSHCDRFVRRMAVLRRMRELDLRIVTPWHLAAWIYSPFPLTGRVYGVFDEFYRRQVAQVMEHRFPGQHVLVVRGRDGIDEISVCGVTDVTELREGRRNDFTLSPACLGLRTFSLAEVSMYEPEDFRRLGSPDLAPGERSAIRLRTAEGLPGQVVSILSGRGRPAHEALVAVNAGAAFYVGGLADSVEAGTSRALGLLRDGSVWRHVSEFVRANATEVPRRSRPLQGSNSDFSVQVPV